jgi:hypothetical protein
VKSGVNVLAIDPVNPTILYAATSAFVGYAGHAKSFRGLFKSTDGGQAGLQSTTA